MFLDGVQIGGEVGPGRATAMRAACIAGLKKGLEDRAPEPETVDQEIEAVDGDYKILWPFREPGEDYWSCSGFHGSTACLGYVFKGLEDLPDEQLPQMPVVWVYVGPNPGSNPPYLYNPPSPICHFEWKRRRAHAMSFKVESRQ